VGWRINVRGNGHIVERNLVGVAVDGQTPLGSWGMRVAGGSNIIIGSDNPSDGNVISGNSRAGLSLEGGDNIEIKNNTIGADITRTIPVSNKEGGIIIEAGSGYVIESNFINANEQNSSSFYSMTNAPVRYLGEDYTDIVPAEGDCGGDPGINVLYAPLGVTRGKICFDGQVYNGVNGDKDVYVAAAEVGTGEKYTVYFTEASPIFTDPIADCSSIVQALFQTSATCNHVELALEANGDGSDFNYIGLSGASIVPGFSDPSIEYNEVTYGGINLVGVDNEGVSIINNTFASNQGAGLQIRNSQNLDFSGNTFEGQFGDVEVIPGDYIVSATPFSNAGQDYTELPGGGEGVLGIFDDRDDNIRPGEDNNNEDISGAGDIHLALIKDTGTSFDYVVSNSPLSWGGTDYEEIPHGIPGFPPTPGTTGLVSISPNPGGVWPSTATPTRFLSTM